MPQLTKHLLLVVPLGDGGYPYSPQQIALGAEGAKTASKYGENEGEKLCVMEKGLFSCLTRLTE